MMDSSKDEMSTLKMFYKCVASLNIGHFSDGFSGDKCLP